MRITLTDDEIITLAHIMDHFSDYIALDDRPDHGLGVLKRYRKLPIERKREIFILTNKFSTAVRRIQNRIYHENTSKSI